ncbi:hypothetical protein LJR029_001524 [Caballeronia sp. LjRoot29]|uniref:hypothetical protein n=1 Tax=Caballeronia sp. LjRoot29 TaxID=3342315 RepID=UPI003ECCADF8
MRDTVRASIFQIQRSSVVLPAKSTGKEPQESALAAVNTIVEQSKFTMDSSTYGIPMKNKRLACVLGLTCTLLAGCLTTIPKIDAQHSGGVQTKQAISDGIQPPKIDANGNLVTPWVRNSMMSAFYMRAAHLGIKINPTGVPVTIHITSVRSRSDTARILLNFVDGADNLDGVVEVGDASFTIQEDTWLYWPITNWRSIEEVSNAVGEQAANGIALIAGLPIED